MKYTCHYLNLSKYSSNKISDLVNQLLVHPVGLTDQARRDLIKDILSWATSHIDLRSAIVTNDLLTGRCEVNIHNHRSKLHTLQMACDGDMTTPELEKMILQWYNKEFMETENACPVCSYNTENQHGHACKPRDPEKVNLSSEN